MKRVFCSKFLLYNKICVCQIKGIAMIIYEPKKRNSNINYADRQNVYDYYIKYNLGNITKKTSVSEFNGRSISDSKNSRA